MTTTITLVRHTDVHNPEDILYGRLPRFGLSDLGLQQGQVTAAILAKEHIDAFYCSPQLRARQTVAILREQHADAPLHISRLLAEVLTGWQGRPHADLDAIGFNFYDNPMHPGDENLDALWSRIQRFVMRARRAYHGKQVVAVTHGDLCHLARAGYCGLPIEVASIRWPHPYPGKGSLTRLIFTGDLRAMFPESVEYFDPNGDDPAWSRGWVELDLEGEAA